MHEMGPLAAFQMEYQPVIALADGRVSHVEALARFHDGSDPGTTIRKAEDLDLILGFDLTVAGRVAKAAQMHPAVAIATNLSALSLMAPGFTDALLGQVAGVAPERLLFEITETADLGDLVAANAAIQRLRQAGHLVCLDDLGSGWMQPVVLESLNVDIVKFDGDVVHGADLAALKAMIAFCRRFPVRLVAEQVETEATEIRIRDLGFDLAQGWRFGRPSPQVAA